MPPPDQLFVCFLVLACVALFIWEKISPDVVSMGVLLLLLVVPFGGHGILIVPEPLKSAFPDQLSWEAAVKAANIKQSAIFGDIFANNAILTVIFMFIVGAAADRSGLVEALGRAFEKVAGRGGRRTLLALGLLTIPTSAFLNNTTVVVVFVPMVLGLCRRANLIPSRYLIPLSYFAIVGGLCTIIGTSTNILVKGIVERYGLPTLSMFEITPVGLIISATTLGFIVLFGGRLLPDRASLAALIDTESSGEFLLSAIITEHSILVGKPIADSPLAANKKLRLIEARRRGNRVETPLNTLILEAGDRIILKCRLSGKGSTDLSQWETETKNQLGLDHVRSEKAILMEGLVGPHSHLIGRTLSEISFRQQYGVLIVAIHREGENQRDNLQNIRLEVGDTLLLEGSRERMTELFSHKDFINLTEKKATDHTPGSTSPTTPSTKLSRQSWVAILSLLAVVILGAAEGHVPYIPKFEWVALSAALLVVLGGCLKKEEIYEAVEWRIIVMILGTLGLGQAMKLTGADKTIVNGLMSLIGTWDKRLILSAILLLTIVFTELLSNNAVAALLTPLVIPLAQQMGSDPRAYVVAVLIGSSIGFAIPAGYQTHMLVYSAGGYRFSDFFRIGLTLDIICWVVGSLTIPLFWAL
jgi:di/tricarboxylate transporter